MSPEINTYLLGLTLAWGLLLAYYALALGEYRNWAVKRWLLLGGYAAGLLLPGLAFINWAADSGVGRAGRYVFRPLAESVTALGTTVAPDPIRMNWLLVLYLTGVVVVLLLKGRSVWQLRQYRREGTFSDHTGFTVVRHACIGSPFVALGRIYLPLNCTDEVVLLHETEHLRAGHYVDGLLLDIGQILFWFHPLHYLFRRWLSDVHEYHCDRRVTTVIPARTYGRHLLRYALADGRPLGIATSPLKSRITMLFQTDVTRFSFSRLAVLLLLLAGIGFGNLAMAPQPPGAFPEMITYDGTVLKTEEDFVRSFYEYVTYPVSARKNGLIGQWKFEIWADTTGMYSFSSTQMGCQDVPADLTQLVVVGINLLDNPTETYECGEENVLSTQVLHTLNELKLRSTGKQDAIYAFTVKFILE